VKCKNIDNLNIEDRVKLEEIEYRKKLIGSHGFGLGDFWKFSKIDKEQLKRKLEEVD